MKKFKVLLAFFIVFQVVFSTSIVSAASNKPSDISGHWAENTITKWLEEGAINGYEDGSFKPNQAMTRAEFIKILNHTFNVEETTQQSLSFSDLPTNHWAYNEIAKAINNGYASGTSDQTFSPNLAITRQEAAVMVAHLLNLEGVSEVEFKDADEIASWSKIAIATLASKSILQGDLDGNVRPRANLSRAEAVTLVDKAAAKIETVFNEAGTYGNEQTETVIEGNVRIVASGVKLLNSKITGNLIIDKAVGEGDVYLTKVEVLGETIVQGGGQNSIHLEDSVLVRIIADKATGTVRIVAIGATTVQEVYVRSSIKLEESQTSGSGFNNVELSSALPAGSNVDLVGHFESVSILAANIKVNIPSGSVNELTVAEQANDTAITLDKDAKVLNLLLNIAAQLLGEGTIEKAVIGENAGESSFATKPKTVEGDPSKIVILPPSALTPVAPPSTGGGGSPAPTPEPTPTNPGTGSSDATLHDVTFTSDVNFEWKKSRLSLTATESVYDFAPSHLEYITVMPSGAASYEVTLDIKHDAGAIVYVYYEDENYSMQNIQKNSAGQYTVTVKNNYDNKISISITSENGKNYKYYSFMFVPETINIQQAFKITGSGSHYSIQSHRLLIGDSVKVTIPANLNNLKRELVFELSVDGNYHNGTRTNFYGSLSNFSTVYETFVPTQTVGAIQIEIIRDDVTIDSGQYIYDFTPLTIKSIDESAYQLYFYTTEELTKFDAENNSMHKYEARYKLTLNAEYIEGVSDSFEYYAVEFYFDNKETITLEETKRLDLRSYNKKSTMWMFNSNFGHVYDPLIVAEDGYHYTNRTDVKLLLTLFDTNKQATEAILISKPIPENAYGQHVKVNK